MRRNSKTYDTDCIKHNVLILAGCIFLYVLNRMNKFYEPGEYVLKYIWDYNFTDYLCQLVFFSISNLFLESVNRRGIYRFKSIIALSAICCLYWEIGVLYTRTGTVYDPADGMAYLLGAVTYYCIFRGLQRGGDT